MKRIGRTAGQLVRNRDRASLTPDTRTPRQIAHTKHGGCGTRLYRIWKNMRRRCELPTHPDYPNYGGRGIAVCERWKDFALFREDMGEPPEGMTLERSEVDKGYNKENCEWATRKQQNRNTRRNRFVVVGGIRMTLAEAAERAGVPYKRVHERLSSGYSLTDALEPEKFK